MVEHVDPPFDSAETALARRLRRFTDDGVVPYDARQIAALAVATRGSSVRGGNLAWRGSSRSVRVRWLVLATALLTATLLGAALAAGSLLGPGPDRAIAPITSPSPTALESTSTWTPPAAFATPAVPCAGPVSRAGARLPCADIDAALGQATWWCPDGSESLNGSTLKQGSPAAAYPRAPGPSRLMDVSVSAQSGFDRIVFTMSGNAAIDVRRVDGAVDAQGRPIVIDGATVLLTLEVYLVDGGTKLSAAEEDQRLGGAGVVELRWVGDDPVRAGASISRWVVGSRGAVSVTGTSTLLSCIRHVIVANPTRIVVDVQAPTP